MQPRPPSSVIIIGSGMVGAATAYFLNARGVAVRLLDASAPAAEATGAADGAVSVASKRPGPMMTAALARLAAALPDHIIVLDTPPCLSTSDASILAPIVGQVVLVVEAERTQRAEVEAALDLVEACPNLQLLLNHAVLTANDTFGAYGGYDAYAAPPGG